MTIPVLLLFGVAILTVQAISQERLKTLLSKTEWMTYVGSNENEGVEVVWHDVRGGNVQGKLHLTAHGEIMELQLKPASLLDPHLVLISRGDNGSRLLSPSLATSHSFYTHPGRAALALSQGVHGIIFSEIDDSYFLIRPLPARFHNRASEIPHVVVKKKIATKFGKLSRKTRSIRSLRPVHIETAVFVDRDLYQHMTTNFPKNTEQELVKFVLTMVNAVQMLYHDPSLGRPVSFVVKRLEILHVEPIGLVRSHDIDRFLGNFCVWQKGENPGEDSNPLHWDHALMLTGLDLYVLAKNGKISKQVVGLAPVAGMCTPTSSCTVNEGRHFESVYVVAHEIGHNLGMRHDGPLADNNCDPGSYLMSPTLGSGKITWSSCSRDYLDQFLHTPQSHCLMDHSRSVEQLDHSGDGLLPGERFSADQQCTFYNFYLKIFILFEILGNFYEN